MKAAAAFSGPFSLTNFAAAIAIAFASSIVARPSAALAPEFSETIVMKISDKIFNVRISILLFGRQSRKPDLSVDYVGRIPSTHARMSAGEVLNASLEARRFCKDQLRS